MSEGWAGQPDTEHPRPGAAGILRSVWRGTALAATAVLAFLLLVLVRLVEGRLRGLARPWSPLVVRAACRTALRILRIRHTVVGRPMRGGGALVANHASWLDVFALNASTTTFFVAKSEVAGWPAIGPLARAAGTVFIERRRARAAEHRAQLEERLRAGHLLAFFPEGTSTDGLRLLPFKTTLFEAFFSVGIEGLRVQPVAIVWTAPPGMRADHFGWWGSMGFGSHLLAMLTAPGGGRVALAFASPIPVEGDRKVLAARAEAVIRRAMEDRLGAIPSA